MFTTWKSSIFLLYTSFSLLCIVPISAHFVPPLAFLNVFKTQATRLSTRTPHEHYKTFRRLVKAIYQLVAAQWDATIRRFKYSSSHKFRHYLSKKSSRCVQYFQVFLCVCFRATFLWNISIWLLCILKRPWFSPNLYLNYFVLKSLS